MLRRGLSVAFVLALVMPSEGSLLGAGPGDGKGPRPLRVLLLASAPTREYQLLRPLLVREMDARRAEVSICLQPAPGREEQRPGIVQDLPAERMLATFPTRLDSYDVVVAFDPDWERLSPEAMNALRKWVETRGGGLVLVAGPINTFVVARKYTVEKLKPIADLYPVVPEDIRTAERDIESDKPRRLNFPAAAGERAFLKLDEKGGDPLAGWEEFFTGRKTGEAKGNAELRRGFFSYYPVRGVKPGAVVLAALADPKARLKDGKDQPFLVTMQVGKGRVVYLSSGETWRLRQERPAYHERFWLGLLAHTAVAANAPTKPAEPAKPQEMPAVDLKLEVRALQTLYQLRFTPEQMQVLARLAPRTAQANREREPGKVSDDYRQLLLDLRNALIDANDEEGIDALQEKLDELAENEKPELEDDVELTAEARRHAPDVLRQMKAAQLAHYAGSVEEEILDPHEYLQTALEMVRQKKADEWEAERDEVAEEVGWLVAGLDMEKSGPITARAATLIGKARNLSAEEFTKRQKELDQEALRIVGNVGPATVIQHMAEHTLAELLSNPRLAAALKARLK